MERFEVGALALAVALLTACGQKQDRQEAASPAPVASAPTQEPAKAGNPDFGGVTKLSREVEAVGSTQELAVLSALQSAVAQVNGVRVAGQLQSVRAGLDMSVNGQPAGSVRSEAFVQKVLAASQGAVTGFEILSQEEIDKLDEQTIARVRASDGGYSYSASASTDAKANVDHRADARINVGADSAQASDRYTGSASYSEKAKLDVKRGASSFSSDTETRKMRSYWKVRVRVDVAQYRAPDEQGQPRIVVAMPKTTAVRYAVGDDQVNAAEVASAVRGRLSDILTQTKRFIVLDREFGSEMQAEIDHINSGNVRVQDSARLGQQLATDLILIPTIERFEYLRSVRQLRMSDRQLVSYSGGARITLRLLNAATGEVVMSDSFDHRLASADPSTMPRVIDGANMAAKMMSSLSGQIGGAVVSEIFPVTVVSLTGDQVVLSQGGESLQAGQRWQAVYLGEELKDPQTGRSLGRNEIPVGTVRIDRVSAQTSYGTLEGGAGALADKPFKPGAIALRQKVAATKVATASRVEAQADEHAPAKPPRLAARMSVKTESASTDSAKASPADRDDKW
jgi:curli biogenesis system outer membrane secretion channel CsgG